MSTDQDSMEAMNALLQIRASGSHGSDHIPQNQKVEGLQGSRQAAASVTRPQVNSGSVILKSPAESFVLDATRVFLDNHAVAFAATSAQIQLAVAQANAVAEIGRHSFNGTRARSNSASQKIAQGTVNSGSVVTIASPGSQLAGVRKEKVAEALRSKPQRGRKRDDLSEKERLELTRTRNREHAKTTRVRKKARYQELLDQEEELHRLREQTRAQAALKRLIVNFVSIRQQMLSTQGSDLQSDLLKLTEDRFHIQQNPSLHDWNSENESPIKQMRAWDKFVINGLEAVIPNYAQSGKLVYEIEGGIDGVAISERKTAFCQFQLIYLAEKGAGMGKRQQVWKGVLSAQFTDTGTWESEAKLNTVQWTTMHASFDHSSVSPKRVEDSPVTMRKDHIHPSMVSLDHPGPLSPGVEGRDSGSEVAMF